MSNSNPNRIDLPEQSVASIEGKNKSFELDAIDEHPVRSVVSFKSDEGEMLEKRVYADGSESHELFEEQGGEWVFVRQIDGANVSVE